MSAREPMTLCGWCLTSDHERCRTRRPPLVGGQPSRCTCDCHPPVGSL